ncbi:MAG: glycosyltransferase family 4 protein [Nitrospinota bacterium]
MRVGIDTAPIAQHRGRGVASFCRGLLEHLLKRERENTYCLFMLSGQEELAERASSLSPGVEVYFRPNPGSELPWAWLWDQRALTHLLARAEPDFLHVLFQWNIPRTGKLPILAHIFDLMPIADASLYGEHSGLRVRLKVTLYARYLKWALGRTRRVIAISANTRRDLVRLMGYPEERIEVIPLARRASFSPEGEKGELSRLRERYGIPEKFILYLGGITPRKNLEVLLRAHAQLLRAGPEIALVIAGGVESPYGRRLKGLAQSLGIDSQVFFPGFIREEDLPPLYRASSLFVYPSLYEGFGLPVLEAMASGVPVLSSNTTSLPEVAGEGALLVEPRDEGAVAEAMGRILMDRTLREELRRRALEQAGQFSWERVVGEILRVYGMMGRELERR